ncbi:TetR family transcriptional regulator [Amycolatopsis thermoflava]|uniref:TetR family transcriptional regulator n=2 Tax=Amycolatopsis thermoflava TaxID=84480 RepID=A0A3N2H7X4_9PSEU|nr:TetR family transcriptional regulator [Amycolatopsis thermoflava]
MGPEMTEFSASGDPKRSLELLWGLQEPPSKGPKARFTVEEITRVAIKLADTAGLAALSMRKVAEELGAGTMSLYTYVPGKAELLDLMVDAVVGETARPAEVPGGWRGRLAQIARENAAVYRRHPWLLQVATSRPPMGPNVIAKYDYELRALEGTGLTDVEMDQVLTLVLGFVHAAMRGVVDAEQAARRSGQSDVQWWESYAPLLEKIFDPERFPVAARVGSAAGEAYQAPSDPQAFEFGLARILDGVEALIASRS